MTDGPGCRDAGSCGAVDSFDVAMNPTRGGSDWAAFMAGEAHCSASPAMKLVPTLECGLPQEL
jgi:hypothetical protein